MSTTASTTLGAPFAPISPSSSPAPATATPTSSITPILSTTLVPTPTASNAVATATPTCPADNGLKVSAVTVAVVGGVLGAALIAALAGWFWTYYQLHMLRSQMRRRSRGHRSHQSEDARSELRPFSGAGAVGGASGVAAGSKGLNGQSEKGWHDLSDEEYSARPITSPCPPWSPFSDSSLRSSSSAPASPRGILSTATAGHVFFSPTSDRTASTTVGGGDDRSRDGDDKEVSSDAGTGEFDDTVETMESVHTGRGSEEDASTPTRSTVEEEQAREPRRTESFFTEVF